MRVVRAIEVLPPHRSSDRPRRRGGDTSTAYGKGRGLSEWRDQTGPDVALAPHGTAAFVTQQIAQEWCPAPRDDAAHASTAYRRQTGRRHRDLLPKV